MPGYVDNNKQHLAHCVAGARGADQAAKVTEASDAIARLVTS